MSSVADRREMKPRTDCGGLLSVCVRNDVSECLRLGSLTFGLGTRKSEGSAMVGSRTVASILRDSQRCLVRSSGCPVKGCCTWCFARGVKSSLVMKGEMQARMPWTRQRAAGRRLLRACL